MNQSDIINIRLSGQLLTHPVCTSVKEVVAHMGAVQAQDYAMCKWAIGIRLLGSTDGMVEAALNKGEVIRTHVLRPTWHLVAAENIRWMLDLTGPRIISSMKSRNVTLELSEKILTKTNDIICKALEGNNSLTREELGRIIERHGIAIDNFRISHIMLRAELEGLVCSGASREKQPAYGLFSERVSSVRVLIRDEALATLTRNYFTSHGPATVEDFVWWSGLTKTDARNGLEMNRSNLVMEKNGEQTYWLPFNAATVFAESCHLLPAYDEFIISYKDRTAILSSNYHQKAVSSNGIFRPVLLEHGKAIGLWKRSVKKNKTSVDLDYFHLPDKSLPALFEKESFRYLQFLVG